MVPTSSESRTVSESDVRKALWEALLDDKDYADALEEVLRLVKEDKAETKKYLEKELIKNINKFLYNDKIKNIKEIKILNLWVVRQYKGEYNPIHYHEGDLSGVGYLKLPKGMTDNKLVKNRENPQTLEMGL